MIPKLSAPLVKDIRTGEGILEWLLAAGVTAAGATSNLSFSHTALYLTIVAGIKGARRGLLKVVAAAKPVVGDPIPFTALGAATGNTLSQVTLTPQAKASSPVDKDGWPA